MLSHGGFYAKAKRKRRCGREAVPDAIVALAEGDAAKALVLEYIAEFVASGYAEWQTLETGDVALEFVTGETYVLTQDAIVRLT